MSIERIFPEGGATPRGHYTPGIRAGDFIYVSGQGPIDPVTDKLVETNVEAQTRITLGNVLRILQAAGAGIADIVKVSIFLKHIDDFAAMNRVYSEFMGDHKPARTTIESKFHKSEMLVEIDCIAYTPR
ncbi:MAG: RidA family protein [Acidobacteriota bacterium]